MNTKQRTIVNVAGQSLEIVLKSGRLYDHVNLGPGQKISVPEKSITDTCLELQKRHLLQII